MSISPQTLAWLHQSAAVDGAAYSQVLLSLLERVEALEKSRQDKLDRLIEQDSEDDDEPQTLHTIALKMVTTLEQLRVLPEILDTLRRAIREPMEQPPAAQLAPTPAPAGGLVERVVKVIADPDGPAELWHDDARAAIREVAAWLRSELNLSVADLLLEQEAGR